MKKLDVRFCLGFRVFEFSNYSTVWTFRVIISACFWGGDRGRSGRKVVFELIYHSLNGLFKI